MLPLIIDYIVFKISLTILFKNMSKDDRYGKRALDFVEKIRCLEQYEDICLAIQNEMEWFGFTFITCMSIPGPGKSLHDTIHLNTRPEQYTKHYIEKNYVNFDPVVTELKKTLYSFSWSDVKNRRKLSKVEQKIINEATEFEVDDGLIIPIATLSKSVSIFSPCGKAPIMTSRARAAVELIGTYSYSALDRYLMINKKDQARKPLTNREKEILTWIAVGKSYDEVAQILNISEATVSKHVQNLKFKLDAFKTTYAVVKALQYGEIHL
ncbi:MAG: LuxR family transcriptional regulator [Pseudomonadota bacterium]